MFRRLLANTAISGLAFLVTGIVGVALVPILLGAYGVAGLGLIALARLFLPLGVLALLDLGVSEIATQAVARAREDQAWLRCSGYLSLLILIALAMGVFAALALGLGAGALSTFLRTPPQFIEGMIGTFQVSAFCLPLLFISLVSDGVIKGFEKYGVIRVMEVASTGLYAGLAVVAVWQNAPFQYVCYAFLASQVLRGALLIIVGLRIAAAHGLMPTVWTRDDRIDAVVRSRLMLLGRLLGSLQSQAAPLFIGMTLGPHAAGVFDILTKLPRTAKAVLGLLSASLLPVAVRLDASSNHQGVKQLGETGQLLLIMTMMPLIGASMTFSEPLLRLWLGRELSPLWGWQSLMFLQPLLMSLIGFGTNMLFGRIRAAEKLYRISLLQVGLQFALSFALSPFLQERAFILGQIVAICSTYPMSMWVISREQNLSRRVHLWLPIATLAALALGTATVLWAPKPDTPLELLVAMAAWVAVTAAFYWVLLPNTQERCLLWRMPMAVADVVRRGPSKAQPWR